MFCVVVHFYFKPNNCQRGFFLSHITVRTPWFWFSAPLSSFNCPLRSCSIKRVLLLNLCVFWLQLQLLICVTLSYFDFCMPLVLGRHALSATLFHASPHAGKRIPLRLYSQNRKYAFLAYCISQPFRLPEAGAQISGCDLWNSFSSVCSIRVVSVLVREPNVDVLLFASELTAAYLALLSKLNRLCNIGCLDGILGFFCSLLS